MRFRALSEPMRLKILRRLFRSEASVGEILEEVGGTQANVSKHLAVLHGSALVDRRKDGTRTVYSDRRSDPPEDLLDRLRGRRARGPRQGRRDLRAPPPGRPPLRDASSIRAKGKETP